MLTFERVKDKDHPYFEIAFALYEVSFPIFERRTKSDQIRALTDQAYHFNLIQNQEGKFLGILLTWHQNDFIYIEHFAISTKERGKSIGSHTLQHLKEVSQKPLILEIDIPIDDISISRKHFYKRAGFIDSGFSHFHPSYRKETQPHNLEIMSYPAIPKRTYEQFKQQLDTHVMQYSRGD